MKQQVLPFSYQRCRIFIPSAPPRNPRAATILNEGKKIAILAGRGALGAGKELEQVAEMLGAPVAKALLGKGARAIWRRAG